MKTWFDRQITDFFDEIGVAESIGNVVLSCFADFVLRMRTNCCLSASDQNFEIAIRFMYLCSLHDAVRSTYPLQKEATNRHETGKICHIAITQSCIATFH